MDFAGEFIEILIPHIAATVFDLPLAGRNQHVQNQLADVLLQSRVGAEQPSLKPSATSFSRPIELSAVASSSAISLPLMNAGVFLSVGIYAPFPESLNVPTALPSVS
jgi:hypothetical protein